MSEESMKGIMYHYVREAQEHLEHFRYLDVQDFAKQLDYLQDVFGILSHDEFYDSLSSGKPRQGAILTFDDGLLDHYKYVYPLLKERGLWGIFYVSSAPYRLKRLLDVHRIHMLLGHLGGERVLNELNERIDQDMLIEGNHDRFKSTTYQHQDNDTATVRVKQIVNYYMRPASKEAVLSGLMRSFFGDEAALQAEFYLSQEQMNEMIGGGMSIASHSDTHSLLSNLTLSEQKDEINKSYEFLDRFCPGAYDNSFCYPYGGSQSFTSGTVEILKSNEVPFAFSVEPRDISAADLGARYSLPRYDCNMFPHGAAK